MFGVDPRAAAQRALVIASRYRVVRTLAEGATGIVYEVVDEATGQTLALKRLKLSTQGTIAMFQREFYALATMRCEHAPRVCDYGSDEDGPFFTMELFDAHVLEELPPMSWRELCRVVRDVSRILATFHARKLVHRDLNARNICITQSGCVKLLDFGSLASFGAQRDVVGVPPFVSPEAFHGQTLDGRSDLYALGALAFYLLSGRHAYPATSFAQLSELWQHPPNFDELRREPRHADMPETLVALVRTLLSPNPMARPPSALSLIDQLQAITTLPDSAWATATPTLDSPKFVGREAELSRILSAFERAKRGRGSSVVVEGPKGLGKTRLLNEAALQLRFQGATVLSHTRIKSDVAYSTASNLATLLLDSLPDVARLSAQPHTHVLAHVSDRVREKLGVPASAVEKLDPATKRVQLQSALHDWFTAVAQECPLVLLVDDLEAVDEPSAAWLTALARDAKRRHLLIVLSGTPAAQKNALLLDLLCQRSATLTLSPLTRDETLEVVESVFPDTPNVPRLAAHLHRACAGNPAECLALCQHLIASDVISRSDGFWVIPWDMSSVELCIDRQEQMLQCFERMAPRDLSLARALCVQTGEVPADVCEALFADAPDLRASLDRLCQAEVLLRTSDGYRFAQEELQKLLYAQIPELQRAGFHAALARAWSKRRNGGPIDEIFAGVHFLQASELRECGRRLVRACVALRGPDDYSAAAPVLEQALLELRKRRRNDRELIVPLACLCIASYFTDRRLAERYGPETLGLMERYLGLCTIRRLRPFLGARLATWLGLLGTGLSFLLRSGNPLIPRFSDALRLSFETISTLVSVHTICVAPSDAMRCARTLEPLAAGLGPKHLGSLVYRECVTLARVVQDHRAEPYRDLERLIELLRDKDSVPGLETVHTELIAGALYARGVQEAWRDDSQALLLADHLERLNGTLYAMYADKVRMLHYGHRGRLHLARKYEQKVEEHAIQSGSAWQVETWSVAARIALLFRTEDAIGMKRATRELQRLSHDTASFALLARRAQGAYLLLRGHPEAAIEELEAVDDPPMAVVGWTRSQATLARAYNVLGRHAEAKRVCLHAMRHLAQDDYAFTAMNLGIEVELAMAEMGLGELGRADHMVDELLQRQAPYRNPLTMGTLHEASARIALSAGRKQAFIEHARAMRAWYIPTAIPTLIQRAERLEEEGTAHFNPRGASKATSVSGTHELSAPSTSEALLLALWRREAGQPETAFLFACNANGGAQLVAQLGAEAPSPSLRWWVQTCLTRAERNACKSALSSQPASSDELHMGSHHFRFIPLYVGNVVVGGAVFDAKDCSVIACDPALLASLGKQLERSTAHHADQTGSRRVAQLSGHGQRTLTPRSSSR